MSTIALPAIFPVTSFSLFQMNNVRAFNSPYGGSESLIDLLNDRWKATVDVGISNYKNAAAIEAFVNAQRSGLNTVNLWHFVRPTPQGTATGAVTLVGAHAAGWDALVIAGGAGNAGHTLLAGDIVGLSPQLLMVASNVTFNGSGNATVVLTNRLRIAQPAGASVVLSYPTAPFRLVSVPSVVYSGTQVNSITLDYLEAVA